LIFSLLRVCSTGLLSYSDVLSMFLDVFFFVGGRLLVNFMSRYGCGYRYFSSKGVVIKYTLCYYDFSHVD